MGKKLIVNADDFGQSDGINKGIIFGHEKGIVTSASLMVRYPAAINAANYARQNSSLSVGLHIDLGEWMYVNNNWEYLYQVVSLEKIEDVKAEIKQQIETFYKIMHKLPTHIDSHQHVHMKESIMPIVIGIAEELGINLRNCNTTVKTCGKFYGQLDDGSPFPYGTSINRLQELISEIEDGITELCCHPCLGNDIQSMYMWEREKELSTLCDPKIREAIIKADIELCSFNNTSFL